MPDSRGLPSSPVQVVAHFPEKNYYSRVVECFLVLCIILSVGQLVIQLSRREDERKTVNSGLPKQKLNSARSKETLHDT
jgi:hypothetical protein